MTNSWPTNLHAKLIAEDVLANYVMALDEARLHAWVDMFTQDASYRVLARENLEQGLPAAVLLLENRSSMQDRVAALEETAVFNIHHARRFFSGVTASVGEQGAIEFAANVVVFQTDQDGHSKLFVVGRLQGRLCAEHEAKRLIERLDFVLDTFTVPTLLALPI